MITHMIPVGHIVIPPGRFREADPDAVEEIAVSIAKYGQLQPIIIDESLNLIDGLHRLTAMQSTGITHIAAVYRDEVDAFFLKELELESNIRRKEMTWQERERAIATLHILRSERDPNWTQAQTQAMVNAPRQADISESLQLVKMMEVFPEISEAKSKAQALSWAKQKAKSILRVEEVRNSPQDYRSIDEKIILGDSVEVIKTIPDESFHAIITDPPFGINYEERTEGTIGQTSSYQDDEESYRRLLSMAPDLYRVLRRDGWLIWFLGISWYEEAKRTFRSAGFTVDEIPIIWDRTEGRTFTSRPDRWFSRGYDIALHAIKGSPTVVQRGHNIIRAAPVSTAETLVERPIELYAELISRLTLPGEIVADFFVGSGSCPAAACSLKRGYFGVEIDMERRAYAIKKIKAHTPI